MVLLVSSELPFYKVTMLKHLLQLPGEFRKCVTFRFRFFKCQKVEQTTNRLLLHFLLLNKLQRGHESLKVIHVFLLFYYLKVK